MMNLLQKPNQPPAKTDDTVSEQLSEEVIEQAQAIYAVELQLAKAHMTKTENRDKEATYNKMTMKGLSSDLCKSQFDFLS